ncbi:bactofilin family protein [Halomonas kalidii]|uniref:bactofilin family protein n=1 Tax=Halomonas kalidii TaxID=3043293 RepID=UPI00389945FB
MSGDLVSQEPLDIHGTINGSVTARQHGVMVAASGTVTDAIDARRVVVAGRVTGCLHASVSKHTADGPHRLQRQYPSPPLSRSSKPPRLMLPALAT